MHDLQSLGHAAALYQTDPRLIRLAIGAVQADAAYQAGTPIPHEPVATLVLNGVEYYAVNDVAKAIAWRVERDAVAKAKAAREVPVDG